MTPQENYLRLQNQCGIKPGDWVRVICASKNNEIGWDNVWDPEMSKFIGESLYVISLDRCRGVRLKTYPKEGFDFAFPFFVLEKVEAPVVKTVGHRYHETFFYNKWDKLSESEKQDRESVGLKLQEFIRATIEVKP